MKEWLLRSTSNKLVATVWSKFETLGIAAPTLLIASTLAKSKGWSEFDLSSEWLNS